MRITTQRNDQRGDTLIEVLVAFTVFAMVVVGSFAIMNSGSATAERSLQITLVRAQMDAQAEAIRYIHKAYVEAYKAGGFTPTGTAQQWVAMTDRTAGRGVSAASPFGTINGSTCGAIAPGGKPFILNARTATIWPSTPTVATTSPTLPPFSQVVYNADSSISAAYGLWVEAVPSPVVPGSSTGYVDFHIRACWNGSGSATPTTLGTIVRLYEPR